MRYGSVSSAPSTLMHSTLTKPSSSSCAAQFSSSLYWLSPGRKLSGVRTWSAWAAGAMNAMGATTRAAAPIMVARDLTKRRCMEAPTFRRDWMGESQGGAMNQGTPRTRHRSAPVAETVNATPRCGRSADAAGDTSTTAAPSAPADSTKGVASLHGGGALRRPESGRGTQVCGSTRTPSLVPPRGERSALGDHEPLTGAHLGGAEAVLQLDRDDPGADGVVRQLRGRDLRQGLAGVDRDHAGRLGCARRAKAGEDTQGCHQRHHENHERQTTPAGEAQPTHACCLGTARHEDEVRALVSGTRRAG